MMANLDIPSLLRSGYRLLPVKKPFQTAARKPGSSRPPGTGPCGAGGHSPTVGIQGRHRRRGHDLRPCHVVFATDRLESHRAGHPVGFSYSEAVPAGGAVFSCALPRGCRSRAGEERRERCRRLVGKKDLSAGPLLEKPRAKRIISDTCPS